MVLCIGLFKNCSFLHPVKLFCFLFYISLLLVYSIFERNYRFDRSVCILLKELLCYILCCNLALFMFCPMTRRFLRQLADEYIPRCTDDKWLYALTAKAYVAARLEQRIQHEYRRAYALLILKRT